MKLTIGKETGSPGVPQFRPGDKIPAHVEYDYKGLDQDAKLTFSIGTGVYPTYNVKNTWPDVTIALEGSMDWLGRSIDAQFTIPTTMAKGTYSARVRLKTVTKVTEETDTEWGALEIV